MAKYFPAEDRGSIELGEFIEHVTDSVDLQDPESIAECYSQLQQLAAKPDWFIDYLNGELLSNMDGDRKNKNSYTSSTFMLATSPDRSFFVRANVWVPSNDSLRREVDKALYAEELLHDHTFDLLTVGLLGPGYRTRLYRYSYEECIGYVGESVDVERAIELQLAPGSVIFMEKNVDIHKQFPPEELSVSINLACRDTLDPFKRQYEFKEESAGLLSIRGMHYSEVLNPRATESIVNICGTFYNDRTKDLLVGLYGRMAEMPHMNEPSIILLRDWFARVGVKSGELPQLKGSISRHLSFQLSLLEDSEVTAFDG